MTDEPRARPLYGLHGVPCVVCGQPAAGVIRTEHGTATAHPSADNTGRMRVCPHPPTGETRTS